MCYGYGGAAPRCGFDVPRVARDSQCFGKLSLRSVNFRTGWAEVFYHFGLESYKLYQLILFLFSIFGESRMISIMAQNYV
jgi:hypothetical protein